MKTDSEGSASYILTAVLERNDFQETYVSVMLKSFSANRYAKYLMNYWIDFFFFNKKNQNVIVGAI